MNLRLLLLSVAVGLLSTVAFPADAPAAKKNYDDLFPDVVQNDKKIGGFVGDYRWLSNFFPCPVEWEGRKYLSAEAAYQSGKFPPADREAFVALDPDAAKKLAHGKPLADPAAWEAKKEAVMRSVVEAKFSQNRVLLQKLLATGRRDLEETNWWDDEIWGVYKGKGQNLLGKILMETRAKFATQKSNTR